jgi:sigma-B regulation protein RsbU (phosphoserine phosphatase)
MLQFLLIKWVILLFYDRPIKKLEYTIKRFLVGSLKDSDIKVQRSTNPHLNYILLFFAKTLGTLKHIKSEFLHGKEIKSEVNLAGEIQWKLLDKKIPKVPSLQIIAKSISAAEIGWDSYDVITHWDNHYIYVGDATGHGVGAGFIMMMVNALVSGYSKVTHKWNHILALTNDIIKPRVKANLLMSMLMVRWDEKQQKMYMTWAGHEYLMIYKHLEQKCYKIKSGGVALGMTKNVHKLLKEREISFEPNDVIILYSDGITEAIDKPKRDGTENMFGEDLLVRVIEESPNIGKHEIKTARSIFKNISIALSKFMGYKFVQLDDVTLVTIQYESPQYVQADDCSEEMWEDFITEWKWTK